MATPLFTYDPSSVTCLVAGLLALDGFVDGSFITINKERQPYQSITTPDGTTARLHNEDSTYKVSITLHSGSSSNDFLTKLWLLDEVSERGKFPLLIKDGSGSDLFFSTTTWIEGVPEIIKSNGIDVRTWVLKAAFAVVNFGGNGEESDIINDLVSLAASALPSISDLF